jgi:hypothetical protein
LVLDDLPHEPSSDTFEEEPEMLGPPGELVVEHVPKLFKQPWPQYDYEY